MCHTVYCIKIIILLLCVDTAKLYSSGCSTYNRSSKQINEDVLIESDFEIFNKLDTNSLGIKGTYMYVYICTYIRIYHYVRMVEGS